MSSLQILYEIAHDEEEHIQAQFDRGAISEVDYVRYMKNIKQNLETDIHEFHKSSK